ncbi:phosphate acyltransferase PlsX [Zavarzinia sp. CC-PAN008]|uniref:phosphate acyltransferase PlsX n=1 Tax=Zavarzinia sp. CC-PAN008 TaxID=3243332 RepID=UPI003F74A076
MDQPLVIALDAMGGDKAPAVVVEGADMARIRYPGVRFLLVGDQARLTPALAALPHLAAVTDIVHTETTISGDDKVSTALRRGKGTSMWLTLEAVRDGRAQAAVSAGNTGALMAVAKFLLRTLPGIDRPAIASFFPTVRGESVLLDLGANVDVDERNLVEFAIMGAAFARTTMGQPRPSVALLNVGSEETKGTEAIRAAGTRLREAEGLPLNFIGYVEGDGIGAGHADVIVADGFAGNVALKTAEGTARQVSAYMAAAFRRNLFSKIGYLFARASLMALRDRLDPQRYNGGVFLGLNGLAVKSHGGTNATGFASAIGLAVDMARGHLTQAIAKDLLQVGKATAEPEPAHQ